MNSLSALDMISIQPTTYKRSYKLSVVILGLSQICEICNIPYKEYISIVILMCCVLIYSSTLPARAMISACICFVLLLFGIVTSYISGVANTNFVLCIGYAANCFIFCTLAEGQAYKINGYWIKRLANTILIFGAFSCVVNLIKNYLGILNLSLTSYSYSAVFSSFYSGRNSFASFLLVYIVLSTYLLFTTKKRVYLLGTILFLINVFFTFSRSALVFCIIFFGTCLILRSRISIKKRLLFLIILLILIIMAVWAINRYYDFLDHFLFRSAYGDSNRLTYWRLALHAYINSPFLGCGAGCAEYILSILGNNAGGSFHNTYIEILLWGGPLFLVLHMMMARRSLRAISSAKRYDISFYQTFISLWIAFFVYCLFETSMLFAIGARGIVNTFILYSLPLMYAKTFVSGGTACNH